MRYKIILVALLLSLISCSRTQYVYVPQVQVRDSITTQIQHDSIYIRVSEIQRGDTIYKDSIVYNYILRRDTIRYTQIDSIPCIKEIPVYVERQLTHYQRTMINLGWLLIILVVLLVGYKIVKIYLKSRY